MLSCIAKIFVYLEGTFLYGGDILSEKSPGKHSLGPFFVKLGNMGYIAPVCTCSVYLCIGCASYHSDGSICAHAEAEDSHHPGVSSCGVSYPIYHVYYQATQSTFNHRVPSVSQS